MITGVHAYYLPQWYEWIENRLEERLAAKRQSKIDSQQQSVSTQKDPLIAQRQVSAKRKEDQIQIQRRKKSIFETLFSKWREATE